MNELCIKIKANSREWDKAVQFIKKAVLWLSIQCKKAERVRMRELVYKYGYIREYLKSPVKVERILDIHRNIIAIRLKNNNRWNLLTREEEVALNDWMKVIEGYNPLWTWKMIADFEEGNRKIENIKEYDTFIGAFLR